MGSILLLLCVGVFCIMTAAASNNYDHLFHKRDDEEVCTIAVVKNMCTIVVTTRIMHTWQPSVIIVRQQDSSKVYVEETPGGIFVVNSIL